jgi:hypothetical protein
MAMCTERQSADYVAADEVCEGPEDDPVKLSWRIAQAVLSIHGKRVYDGDGYGWAICIEDRQHWPCATIQALQELGIGGAA